KSGVDSSIMALCCDVLQTDFFAKWDIKDLMNNYRNAINVLCSTNIELLQLVLAVALLKEFVNCLWSSLESIQNTETEAMMFNNKIENIEEVIDDINQAMERQSSLIRSLKLYFLRDLYVKGLSLHGIKCFCEVQRRTFQWLADFDWGENNSKINFVAYRCYNQYLEAETTFTPLYKRGQPMQFEQFLNGVSNNSTISTKIISSETSQTELLIRSVIVHTIALHSCISAANFPLAAYLQTLKACKDIFILTSRVETDFLLELTNALGNFTRAATHISLVNAVEHICPRCGNRIGGLNYTVNLGNKRLNAQVINGANETVTQLGYVYEPIESRKYVNYRLRDLTPVSYRILHFFVHVLIAAASNEDHQDFFNNQQNNEAIQEPLVYCQSHIENDWQILTRLFDCNDETLALVLHSILHSISESSNEVKIKLDTVEKRRAWENEFAQRYINPKVANARHTATDFQKSIKDSKRTLESEINKTLDIDEKYQEDFHPRIWRRASISINEEVSININKEASININEEASININEDASININEEASININKEVSININEEASININEEASINFNEEASININEEASININEKASIEEALIRRSPNKRYPNFTTEFPFLSLFFENHEELILIKNLVPIVKFSQILSSRLCYRLKRSDARNLTFERFLKNNEGLSPENLYEAFENFAKVWNSVREHVVQFECHEFTTPMLEMTNNLSVVYALFEKRDESLYLCGAIEFLANLQNKFLQRVLAIEPGCPSLRFLEGQFINNAKCHVPQHQYYIESLFLSEIRAKNIINYEWNPELLSYSQRNLELVHLNKNDALGLDVFLYHLELFSTSRTILSEIRELILQDQIPAEKLEFFSMASSYNASSRFTFSGLNTADMVPVFDNPTELLSELEILLCFLRQILAGDLNGLRLKHVVALYELVEEKIADVEIEYISDKYKVKISQKDEINANIDFEQSHGIGGGSSINKLKIPHVAFALVLKRFMFRYLSSEMYNPNEILANFLAGDTLIDCWPVWVPDNIIHDKFPKLLLATNIYDAYQYTIQQKEISRTSFSSSIHGGNSRGHGSRGGRRGHGGSGNVDLM
ncbi:5133_t:CDS:2, partial [Scutellospora calospora]